MRRVRAAILSLLTLALVACDGQTPDEETAPTPMPSTAAVPAVTVVKTRLPADLAGIPDAEVGLPGRMPTGRESMPSLLDDPPGRAVMSYRPIEREDDLQGWAGETIYLWGADARWRRLLMADLGLRADWWPGVDMYGAGQLSPDGRWWATHVGPSVLFLDLSTGRHRLVRVVAPGMRVRFVRWLPDSRAVQSSATSLTSRAQATDLVTVSGRVRPSPYGRYPVAYEPDGTAVFVGRTQLSRWADEAGEPTKVQVPHFWEVHRRSWTIAHGPRLSAVPILREEVEVDDLLAVDRSLEPVGRLVNRRGGYLGPGEGLGLSYGWLDEETLLTSTSSWLVTWSPAEGALRRVVRMPRVPPYTWAGWNASFALDLLRKRSGR